MSNKIKDFFSKYKIELILTGSIVFICVLAMLITKATGRKSGGNIAKIYYKDTVIQEVDLSKASY